MKKLLLSLYFSCACLFAFAQDATFSVTVSSDSVLLGNYIQVSFLLEHANAQHFDPPTFEGFDVISGPNTSSSMSIVNGVMSQSLSYTYYVQPRDIGNYYVTPASITTEKKVLETAPIEIMVLPNPDGIIQQPQQRKSPRMDFFGTFPPSRKEIPATPKKKKKKRKVYKL